MIEECYITPCQSKLLAPPHTNQSNSDYLREKFNGRISSNRTDLIWPPYSFDLNPPDYWYWFCCRKRKGEAIQETAEVVADLAKDAAREVSIETVRRVIKNFQMRLLALIHYGGRHFEPKLKEFKQQSKSWSTPCNRCGQVHYCNCGRCAQNWC